MKNSNIYKVEIKLQAEGSALSFPNLKLKQVNSFCYGDCSAKNILISGDNLGALKLLENQFKNKIKCIYIDPPFNTGTKINAKGNKLSFNDNLDHSQWLGLINARLLECKKLLAEDGFLFLHLDENEIAYAKILLDNVFGRLNYLNTVVVKTHAPSGFKATKKGLISTANYILIYAKDKTKSKVNAILLPKKYDKNYCYYLTNKNEHYKSWKFDSLKNTVAKKIFHKKSYKQLLNESNIHEKIFNKELEEFALKNAHSVFRLAPIGGGAKLKRHNTILQSRNNKGIVFQHPFEQQRDFYILNGNQMLFYQKRFCFINGKATPTQALTDIWTDISWNGIAQEGGVTLHNAKKPEQLLKRIIELSTNENDWILDCYLGSGTTAAVAHKLKRNWIGIEFNSQTVELAHKRLKNIVDGKDKGGITKESQWNGGGGFLFWKVEEDFHKQKQAYNNSKEMASPAGL